MRPEDGKKIYDSIEIPDRLSEAVNRAIRSRDKEEILRRYEKERRRNRTVRFFRNAAAAAAALILCLTVGVNSNEAFAREVGELPVIGALARVLTVRSWHGTDGDYEIDMEVPRIEAEGSKPGEGQPEDAGGTVPGSAEEDESREETQGASRQDFTGEINAEIEKIVDSYMEEARAEFQEYKKAFFETGGTEEEWNDRKMDITVDYTVKYQEGNILSLELVTAKGWVAASEERHYYNLDLAQERALTLEDVLGEDYVRICNESIDAQIREQIRTDEMKSYFGYGPDGEKDEEMGIEGFTTVSENTKFYLNEAGNVVVVFDEYEIAPGYMGMPEFEIEK